MSKYEFMKELGRGGNASVHLVRSKQSNKQFACKMIPKLLDPTKVSQRKLATHLENVQQEISIMKRLQHKENIIQLQEVIEDDDNIYIVMDKCDGGDLSEYMEKHKNNIDETSVRDLIKNCLKTLATCHANNIIHNDVKPQNFLLQNEDDLSSLKLIDFGISVFSEEMNGNYVSFENTPWYCSPESLESKNSKKTDVWQVGVMTHLLLTGKFPFNDKQNPFHPSVYKIWNSVLNDTIDFKKDYWKHISESGKDFIKNLLTKNPSQRPTVFEALLHHWITQKDVSINANIGLMVVDNMRKYYKKNVLMRTMFEEFIELLIQKQGQTCAYIEQDDMEDSSLYDMDKAIITLNSKRLCYLLNVLQEKMETLNERTSVSKNDFKAVLKRLNSKEQIDNMFDKADIPISDSIDIKTIISSQINWNKLIEKNEEFEHFISEVFHEMDQDHTGIVRKTNVGTSCKVLFNNKSVLSFDEFFNKVNDFVVENTVQDEDGRVHGSNTFASVPNCEK